MNSRGIVKKGDLVTFRWSYYRLEKPVFRDYENADPFELVRPPIVTRMYARRVLGLTGNGDVVVNFKGKQMVVSLNHVNKV